MCHDGRDQEQYRVERVPGPRACSPRAPGLRDRSPRDRRRGMRRRWCRFRCRDADEREQPGRAAAQQPGRQQGQRIQILRAAQQTPVQAARGTVRRSRGDRGHHLAGAHRRALRQERADRLVCRAQRRPACTGEDDGEHSAARDQARERDPAGCRDPYRGARRRGQIHSAVPRPVHGRRRLPAPYDRGARRPQRPAPVAVGGRGHARAHDEQGQGEQRDEQSAVHAAVHEAVHEAVH